jgi:hypothetical protein
MRGLVIVHEALHLVVEYLLIVGVLHIYEVDDDDSTQIGADASDGISPLPPLYRLGAH